MMSDDVLTVIWKERKGLLRVAGRRGQIILMMVTPLLVAIVMPIQLEMDWVEKGFSLILAIILPLLLVGTTIPASFAGEREKHTLPTLLASRLSDRAILVGKVATSVIFSWVVLVFVLLLSLVTMNVLYWDGRLILFAPTILLADLGLGFLFSLLTAGAGVLFSLRSSTIQEAQQSLMAVLLIPPMLLQFGFFILMGTPSGEEKLKVILGGLTFEQFCLILAGVLVVLAAILLMAAERRFNRARLILS